MDTEVRTDQTGAPTDLTGGMPATSGVSEALGLDQGHLEAFAAIADHLIPAAHGMPSAAEIVIGERLSFVLRSRPDLGDPLKAALRSELGSDVSARLATLADEPVNLGALQLAIVAGYYTDKRVRQLIEYPGQEAIEVMSWIYPPYLEEGLIDAVMARGPLWRDPATGERAVVTGAPPTYAERTWSDTAGTPGGGRDGRDGA